MVRIAFEKKIIEKIKSLRVSFKIKAISVPEIIEELCLKVFELNNAIKNIEKSSGQNTLTDLLIQLLYLEKKATKKERVLFFILKEGINDRTVFLKSIIKRLSWKRPVTTQEAQNIIIKLEKQGLVSVVKHCPNCKTDFKFLPHQCEKCGYKLILQDVSFRDKRLRPRYVIEITVKGIDFVKELIKSYHYIDSFFSAWEKYFSSNLLL